MLGTSRSVNHGPVPVKPKHGRPVPNSERSWHLRKLPPPNSLESKLPIDLASVWDNVRRAGLPAPASLAGILERTGTRERATKNRRQSDHKLGKIPTTLELAETTNSG